MAFSLRWLLVAVAFAGLVVAGMMNANRFWIAGVNGLFLFICGCFFVLALYGSAASRAFAVGHLFFTVGYFLLAHGYAGRGAQEYFLTHHLFESLHPRLSDQVELVSPGGIYPEYVHPNSADAYNQARRIGSSAFLSTSGIVVVETLPSEADFIRLGHTFFAIIVGVIGGVIASAVQRRHGKERLTATA